jgi:hypothetical protein
VADFSKINSKLKKRDTEIGNIGEIFSSLQGEGVASLVDMSSFYHNLKLTKRAQEICTMTIAGRLLRPSYLMEGINQGPPHGAFIINLVRKRSAAFTSAYIDDVICAAPDVTTLRKRTILLMMDLQECGALISLPKCQFERTEIDILGHTVLFSPEKVTTIIPQTARFKVFQNYPKITSVSQMQRFLGLLAYVQSFGQNIAFLAAPCYGVLSRHNTLPKNQQVILSDVEQRSVDLLCRKMCNLESQVVIGAGAELHLYVDASYYGYGCILTATYGGQERIASYHSKRFSESFVRNNSSASKEVYSTMRCCTKFRIHILQAASTTIHSDCAVLMSLMLRVNAGRSLGHAIEGRWLYVMASYPLTFKHSPRDRMQAADALSKLYSQQPNHDHLVEYQLKTMKSHQLMHNFVTGKEYQMTDMAKIVEDEGIALIAEHPKECRGCETPPPGPRECLEKGCVEISPEEKGMEDTVESMECLSNWLPACQFLRDYPDPSHRVQVNSFTPQPLLGYDIPTIIEIQEADDDSRHIIEVLQTQHTPPHRYARYKLIQNILLTRIKNKNEPPQLKNLAIVLPRPEVTRLVYQVHNLLHSPPEKLLQVINRHFHNPQMRQVTKAIANACLTCLVWKRKTSNDIPAGAMPPAQRPMQLIYTDFGFFKKVMVNGRKFRYLLLFVDSFSFFLWGVATNNMKEGTVLEALRVVLPHLQSTEILTSDNQNTLLDSDTVRKFVSDHGIRPVTTLPYSSSSNYCELGVKMVRQALRLMEAKNGKNWVHNLSHAFALVNGVFHTHGSLPKKSPYELVHNTQPLRDPLEQEFGQHEDNEAQITEDRQTIEEIKRLRYDAIQANIRARIDQSQLKKGSLVVLLKHGKERKSKQESYYHPSLYLVRDRHHHKIIISPWDDMNRTFRVHISKVKLFRRCPKEFYLDLNERQRLKMGPVYQESLEGNGADSDYSADTNAENDSGPEGPDNQDPPPPPPMAPNNSERTSTGKRKSPFLDAPRLPAPDHDSEVQTPALSDKTAIPTESWKTESAAKSSSRAARAGRSLRKALSSMASSLRKGIFTPKSSSQTGSIAGLLRSRPSAEARDDTRSTNDNLSNSSRNQESPHNQEDSTEANTSDSDTESEPPEAPVPVGARRSQRQNLKQRFDYANFGKTGKKDPKN